MTYRHTYSQAARERTAVLKHHMTFHHPTALGSRPIRTESWDSRFPVQYLSIVRLAGGQFMDQVANSLFFSVRGIARIERGWTRTGRALLYVWWST